MHCFHVPFCCCYSVGAIHLVFSRSFSLNFLFTALHCSSVIPLTENFYILMFYCFFSVPVWLLLYIKNSTYISARGEFGGNFHSTVILSITYTIRGSSVFVPRLHQSGNWGSRVIKPSILYLVLMVSLFRLGKM